MKIKVKNKTIDEKDLIYVSEGGEKKVFRIGNLAYAIYHDPIHMIPVPKIKELSKLDLKYIINPKNVIQNEKGNNIGYTMDYIQDGIWFSKLFNKNFRKEHDIDDKKSIKIISNLRKLVNYVHENNCLIVDLNEMNFILNEKNITEIFSIDTTSYQTPSYPATAIVPLIKDPHASKFDQNTDWYSWGMLVSQLLIGTNPFRGKHKDFDKFSLNERVEERKKANVSIFNKDVKLPGACRSLDILPKGLYDWMFKVYEQGERIPPPENFEELVQVAINKAIKHDKDDLSFNMLMEFKSNIFDLFNGPTSVVVLENGNIKWGKNNLKVNKKCKILCNKDMSRLYSFYIKDNLLHYKTSEGKEDIINISCKKLIQSKDRLFVLSNSNINEVKIRSMGSNEMITMDLIGKSVSNHENILMSDGVILENQLGTWIYRLFKPDKGIYYGNLKEIKGKRIVEYSADSNVLALKTFENNQYNRYIFKFNDNGYSVIKEEAVEPGSINLCVNDQGICCMVVENGDFFVFNNKLETNKFDIIRSSAMTSKITIKCINNKFLAFYDNKLYQIKKN